MLAIRELTRPGSDHVIAQPACSSCGKTLRLTRVTPGSDAQADLRTYGKLPSSPWVITAGTADATSKRRGRSFIVLRSPCLGSPKRECRPPRLGFFYGSE